MTDIENIEQKEQSQEDVQEVFQPITYSQEHVDALQAQIDELIQFKPKEKSEAEQSFEAQEKALNDKQAALWQRQVEVELKEAGLLPFADFINAEVDDVESLHEKITRFKRVLGEMELSHSFKPNDHKSADKYSLAEKQGDTVAMIGSKLANLYK